VQAEEVRKTHEQATVTMRVELEKLTEEVKLIDQELARKCLCPFFCRLMFFAASSIKTDDIHVCRSGRRLARSSR
jgi:hypothetical protein